MTRYSGLELSASGWKVVQVDATGTDRILGAGGPGCGDWRVAVQRQDNGEVRIAIAGKTVWTGRTGAGPDLAGSSTGSVDLGPLGLYAAPNTHVEVTRFEVVGKAEPAHLNYLYTEGLLGAGEPQDVWEQRQGPEFRFGVGAVHRGQGGKAKWNFEGTAVRLWSPTGPEFGEIRVSVDGLRPVLVDLHAGALRGPVAVFERRRLKKGPHCLVVEAVQGAIAIDGVEVVSKAP
jgi:hypothetical protein